jgi:hypothetical protein
MLQGISLAGGGSLLSIYGTWYPTITVQDSIFTIVTVTEGVCFLVFLKNLLGSALNVIDMHFSRTNAVAVETQLVVIDQVSTVQV